MTCCGLAFGAVVGGAAVSTGAEIFCNGSTGVSVHSTPAMLDDSSGVYDKPAMQSLNIIRQISLVARANSIARG